MAYDVRASRIVGPDWMDTSYYDLVATMPPATTRQEARRMLQRLLADRLGMEVHKENRRQPVYALYAEEGRLKLQPGSGGDPNSEYGSYKISRTAGGFRLTGDLTMEQLIRQIYEEVDRWVADKTGLTGVYAIDLEWAPAAYEPGGLPTPSGSRYASLFRALEQQLGLKVHDEPGDVETIVVSRANREPAGN